MFVNKHVSLCDTDIQDVLPVVSLFEEAGRLLGMSSNTSVAVRQRHAVEGTDARRASIISSLEVYNISNNFVECDAPIST